MADVFSESKRSEVMSKIRGKETKMEIKTRKWLHAKGFRFRKNDPRLPGKPDIVLPKYESVVFIHGCFWHGHQGCQNFRIPKTNTAFWENKLARNIQHDAEVTATLSSTGWRVFILWECDLKSSFDITMNSLVSNLVNRDQLP